MINATVTAYTDYFRQLAVHQVDLQHNPAGETGDAPPGSVHFTRWSADEAITGLRSKVSFPALLLELYETNTSAEIEYDVRNSYLGAFSIVASALPENFASEMDAFSFAEKIMTDVLQKIWADHYSGTDRCTTPFEFFNLNYSITPFGPIFDNQFGYRCEFNFNFRRDKKFNQPPATGTFI